ncbi:Spindle and centriole-associated protein 1 Coiled-coil domain-containing protein 52 [Larimichthys crocea]|uniref:Spindle and centriole-associated protein 1 n=1 Tax=Larimichthys crocea TaxID=215358 RepID=A0A6G0HL32_LARCR|nr:Spindle and centriole-associated protein 1 Coiled-coil domain-containing protein 52 [Larimichthys crocea]
MSFVRVGRPQPQPKGKRPVRPKKAAAASRREWVSTVTDLSVHKLTPAELSHRHEIHKSHNKAAAQWELREKALARRLRHPGSPAPLDQASLSIIREVFSDQLLLQDVLARSDRAMAVVKDLFGDAPRRQTGHPSVTMAPHCESDSALPVFQRPDPPTQLSLLSQSMMDQQALNEVEASEDDYSDEDTCPRGRSDYHVIQRSNLRKMKAQSWGRSIQQQKIHHANSDQVDRDNVPVTPCASGTAPDQTALNATVAVQRVRSRQQQSEEGKEEPSVLVSQVLNPEMPLNQSASLSGDQSSLGLLQAMLGQVEADLDTLSPDTQPASAQSQKQQRKQSLTGFSVALVSTLGRLVHLLKQREEEAHKEAQERRRLEDELREQRGLIDALTAETMTLREEAAALQAGLQQQTAELEQKLDTVVLVMGGLGLLEAYTDPHQDSDVKAAGCQSAPVLERDPERPRASVSPAVLLSPPRQSDNWQQISVTHPIQLHQELPPLHVPHSREDLQSHRSASSLTSLPLTSLASTSSLSLTSDPLGAQLSPEAMLAEIAQLSRQNELIKAQLSQAKGRGSGVGGSPNSSNGQKRLSSSSAGRVTPENVGERRPSVSSSTGRKSQHVPSAEEQLTNQAPSPNAFSVSSVEQRLLELNRQSAAARGRLLELIDQQKQSVSAKVSPSDSPVPPSAFSPQSAGGGSPEVSILLPEQQLLSRTDSGERRYTGSEASSHSLGGETRDGKTQVEKRREREGWFSLSAHR